MKMAAEVSHLTATERRAMAVAIARKRIKRNCYTQGALRAFAGGYPEEGDGVPGYSDCSSFVRWVMRKVLGVDIGADTGAQIENRARGVLVEKAAASQDRPTEELLEPGDLVYFKGTPSHTWGAGHVEMVLGGGKCIGHGSGTGPTVKVLKTYSRSRGKGSRKYLCTIRWILDDAACALGTRLLKFGDEGTDVLSLQKCLKALGYELGAWGANGDGLDGEYGGDTRRAVRAFEQAHGLTADGVADVQCLRAILLASGHPIGTVRVTRGAAHVRSGPGAENPSLGIVRAGDELALSGDDTEAWRGVLFGDCKGYVSTKYLEAV